MESSLSLKDRDSLPVYQRRVPLTIIQSKNGNGVKRIKFTNITKFNPGELAVSAVITTISSLLSILGGLVLIWSYYVVSSTRNTVRLMLISLTLADILTASGYLMATVRWYSIGMQKNNTCDSASDNFCKAQSFITTFSSIASFLWTSFIAIYLFICVWFSRVVDISGVKFMCVHVVAWGIRGLKFSNSSILRFTSWIFLVQRLVQFSLMFFLLGKNEPMTGINGVWCWLAVTSYDHHGVLWMLLAGKGWEILTYLITAILYLLLKGKRFLNLAKPLICMTVTSTSTIPTAICEQNKQMQQAKMAHRTSTLGKY
ncbi:G-protein coupled receptor 157-like [Mytilus edulis]|uniref:G-protein coupled receptor 157-like n=1 Tax=Mytilus edulis TaxID=6550 RepID=UPI0039EE5242